MASKTLLQAIAVTAELTGTQLTEPAARIMAADLSLYPEAQVLAALERCRRELKGRLTIAEVVSRLEDGRPGAEEAWALCPRDEAATVVWTAEMQQAWGVAQLLIDEGDLVAARMAFIEAYRTLVTRARANREPTLWQPSLGHDVAGREAVLAEAVRMGRLPKGYLQLSYRGEPPAAVLEGVKLLEGKGEKPEADAR